MINANPGFPIPTDAQLAAAAPGTLFAPLLDFSPAKGESWRSPKVLRAKVYVNAPEGADWTWADGGFYQIDRLSPREWRLSVTKSADAEGVVAVSWLSWHKTRQAALDAAAAHLRERAEVYI